jgi:phasin
MLIGRTLIMARQDPTGAVMEAAERTTEATLEKAHEATENYLSWVEKTMAGSPWGNTDFSKKLVEYTTQNVNASFQFVQRLGQAKNFQDVVRLQSEFMETQFASFNEQAKNLSEAYTKAMAGITKGMPFHMST